MKKILVILVWFVILQSSLFANYEMRIANVERISENSYKLEVFIKSTANYFIISAYQCALKIPSEFLSGGTLSFSYQTGSSQLSIVPNVGIGAVTYNDSQILTFGSLPSSDTISSEIKVGSFIITNSVPFAYGFERIDWVFDGNINTIITGENFADETDSSKHLVSSSPTGTKEKTTGIPSDFSISQNYPNPFNPVTQIDFSLRESGKVSLAVYNLVGEKVADLVDGHLEAGHHTVAFNASELASGVYVYKIDAENKFSAIKKMILLK